MVQGRSRYRSEGAVHNVKQAILSISKTNIFLSPNKEVRSKSTCLRRSKPELLGYIQGSADRGVKCSLEIENGEQCSLDSDPSTSTVICPTEVVLCLLGLLIYINLYVNIKHLVRSFLLNATVTSKHLVKYFKAQCLL